MWYCNDEAFWKGKQWTEKQIKEMSALKKPAYKINMIGGIEIQRQGMRERMGLSSTEGLAITEKNMKKLEYELNNCIHFPSGRIISGRRVYKDFLEFTNRLIEKYFTKE